MNGNNVEKIGAINTKGTNVMCPFGKYCSSDCAFYDKTDGYPQCAITGSLQEIGLQLNNIFKVLYEIKENQ